MKNEEFINKLIEQNLKGRRDYKKPPKYPLPFEEKKVIVTGMVKRKYYLEAQKAVKNLLEQWR